MIQQGAVAEDAEHEFEDESPLARRKIRDSLLKEPIEVGMGIFGSDQESEGTLPGRIGGLPLSGF